MLSDLLIISGLILLNGFFALSELAVLSAKPTRLRMLANAGRAGAGTALKLAEDPSRFLSSVQIGITLVGIFAGAYGGATLSAPLAERLATVPLLASHADTLAFGGVVAVLTYLSLIIGELVPKQLALAHAEPLAAFVSRPMRLMAALSAPLVGLLDVSTRLVLKLLGQHAAVRHKVSDEEIHALLAEASEAGVVERSEHEMLHRVMRFADRPVEAIMTPRPDILWLDIDADQHTLLMLLETRPHSRLPVCRGELDEIQGIVLLRDLLIQHLRGEPLDVQKAMRTPLVVQEGMRALGLLEILRVSAIPIAIVVDEYGSVQGLVTAMDILAALAGETSETLAQDNPMVARAEDGSYLLDGGLPLDEMAELLGLSGEGLPRKCHTLGGFVLHHLGHLPRMGEQFEHEGQVFEVVDMDGRRIDRVMVRQSSP
ncbi:MAG: HlyC/CorC family transporter [Halothiobacillaceae bacterium]|nr:MAG: HlyC/CorC family transporter [Halothiobacillaceae bacterium]